MKKAKLIFVFTKQVGRIKSKTIEIKYNNFEDLTTKVRSYRENGIIVTTAMSKQDYAMFLTNHAGVNVLTTEFDNLSDNVTVGTYVGQDNIRNITIEFIHDVKQDETIKKTK